jgi:tartrate dehydrogenase/decarboxylase/D-malate dehydrogenase
VANPLGSIWAGALMLENLGEQAAADRVLRAMENAMANTNVRTRDLGGNATTEQMSGAVIAALQQ